MKIWRTDDERLLPDGIQQMNIGDGDKADISADETTAATIFEETMNGTLYSDVLQQELPQSIRKLLEQIRVHVLTRSGALTYVKTRPRKNGKIEAERIGMASEKSASQSN